MEFFSDTTLQSQLLRSIVPLLMAVLFGQSGLDKVTDFRGNLDWMTGHFSKTILKGIVRPSLIMITVLELASALLCVAGVAGLWFFSSETVAFWALLLSAVTLLQLFAGQRIAKDYAGAATIAMYVLIAAAGMFLLR
ncbi:MAG: hypothetical protein U1F27_16345 [Turneriella sp.]